MRKFTRESTFDQLILYGSGLVLLVSICLLLWGDDFGFNQQDRSKEEQVGKVTLLEDDVRYKAARTLVWVESDRQKEIYIDDSLFVGKNSQAEVEMKNGSKIFVKSNSMVKFAKKQNLDLLQFKAGAYSLAVKGNLKVEIAGQVTELSGADAEVEIKSDKISGEAKLFVTKGHLSVLVNGAEQSLRANQGLKINPNELTSIDKEAFDGREKRVESPFLNSNAEVFDYFYKLYDVYSVEGSNLKRKIKENYTFDAQAFLEWERPTQTLSELKVSSNWLYSDVILNSLIDGASFDLKNLKKKSYYWKVRSVSKSDKSQKSDWSESQTLVISPIFKTNQLRELWPPHQHEYGMNNGKVSIEFRWQNSIEEGQKYIFEFSNFSDFPTQESKSYWLHEPKLKLEFAAIGEVFWRVRSVNENFELSEWSPAQSLILKKKKSLPAPILPIQKLVLDYKLKKRKPLSWYPVNEAKGYWVEVYDPEQKRRVSIKQTKATKYFWSHSNPGHYRYRVTAIDKNQASGLPSRWKDFDLLDPTPKAKPKKKSEEQPKQLLATKEKKKVKREPAAKKKISHRVRRPKKKFSRNQSYKESFVQAEGSSFAMFSSTQKRNGSEFALAMMTTLRSVYWFNHRHGVEGAFRSKVASINDVGSEVSPLSLEARYMMRWNLPFFLPRIIPELQLSPFIGFEMYRNNVSGGSEFVDGYEMLKGGLAMRFPLFSNFDAGGEFTYGLGLDSSHKIEMQGFLNYYFQPQWSLGLGYRIHLFSAGEGTSTPDGTFPYREGFGEGFGNLKYSF